MSAQFHNANTVAGLKLSAGKVQVVKLLYIITMFQSIVSRSKYFTNLTILKFEQSYFQSIGFL